MNLGKTALVLAALILPLPGYAGNVDPPTPQEPVVPIAGRVSLDSPHVGAPSDLPFRFILAADLNPAQAARSRAVMSRVAQVYPALEMLPAVVRATTGPQLSEMVGMDGFLRVNGLARARAGSAECLEARTLTEIVSYGACEPSPNASTYGLIVLTNDAADGDYVLAHEIGHLITSAKGEDVFERFAAELGRINAPLLTGILQERTAVAYLNEGMYQAKERPEGFASKDGFGVSGIHLDLSNEVAVASIRQDFASTTGGHSTEFELDQAVSAYLSQARKMLEWRAAAEESADLFARLVLGGMPNDPVVIRKMDLLVRWFDLNSSQVGDVQRESEACSGRK